MENKINDKSKEPTMRGEFIEKFCNRDDDGELFLVTIGKKNVYKIFDWLAFEVNLKRLKTEFDRSDSEGQVEAVVMPKIADVIEQCAQIAEQYEPDEKLDYVTYASKDIRKLKSNFEV